MQIELNKILKILGPVIFIAGLYYFFHTSEIKQPDGILAPNSPTQNKTNESKTWFYNHYKFFAVAEFEITCKVLSIKQYSTDKMSGFCPIDIAVGWVKMSDQFVVDQLEIKQQHRWYVWRTKNFPIPRKEIEISSSNIHIIPANENITDQIEEFVVGNIVRLKGYLVNVKDKDSNFIWKSSTSRFDTGNGACEILWVEEAEKVK